MASYRCWALRGLRKSHRDVVNHSQTSNDMTVGRSTLRLRYWHHWRHPGYAILERSVLNRLCQPGRRSAGCYQFPDFTDRVHLVRWYHYRSPCFCSHRRPYRPSPGYDSQYVCLYLWCHTANRGNKHSFVRLWKILRRPGCWSVVGNDPVVSV